MSNCLLFKFAFALTSWSKVIYSYRVKRDMDAHWKLRRHFYGLNAYH